MHNSLLEAILEPPTVSFSWQLFDVCCGVVSSLGQGYVVICEAMVNSPALFMSTASRMLTHESFRLYFFHQCLNTAFGDIFILPLKYPPHLLECPRLPVCAHQGQTLRSRARGLHLDFNKNDTQSDRSTKRGGRFQEWMDDEWRLANMGAWQPVCCWNLGSLQQLRSQLRDPL
jgi:hypothetical protein